MVQKDQEVHIKQDLQQKLYASKLDIQFKMAFPNQKTPNMCYLQLLRGYTIINVHMREHQVCVTFYPKSRFKKHIHSGC